MTNLPDNVEPIEDIVKANPSLKDFAKFYNKNKYCEAGFGISSQPQTHPDITIYGIWLIDKENAKQNKGNKIVQDFIAYNRKDKSYTYYSGGEIHDEHHQGRIRDFCTTYGKGTDGQWSEYGCISDKWTTNHRYKDETDPNLPIEKWIRDKLKHCIKTHS